MSGARASLRGPANLGAAIDETIVDDAVWLVDIDPDGREEVYTYGDLRRQTSAIAGFLAARGLGKGDRVAIVARNSAAYLLAFFGGMQAGCCVVPINPRFGDDVIAHIVRETAARLVLVDGDARAPEGAAQMSLDELTDAARAGADDGPAPVKMNAEDCAAILYTSGSTGLPKGVPLTHGGYLWALEECGELGALMREGKSLIAAPLFHMNALAISMIAARFGGGQVLMRKFRAGAYLEAIARHKCAIVTSVPTMLAMCLREPAAKSLDLDAVNLVLTGSAPSTDKLLEDVKALFPNALVSNSWGATEVGFVTFGGHPEGLPKPLASVGYPSVEVKLLGKDGAPVREEGELWVCCPAVAPGYLDRPDETASRFDDGWFRTGDVMRRDADGFFYFVGRADDMFVCGGENIYPGEVERMLERMPAVAQAVVAPRDDPLKHKTPVAFLVLKPGQQVTEEAVKAFALANGPAYAAPRAVFFMDEMPLAGPGKIDRKRLERAAQDA